jgi:hypothetical protein
VECATAGVREMTEQALLSRGDRRLADALEAALIQERSLEEAVRQSDLSVDDILYRQRERDEPLPWALVDSGVRTGFLEQESSKAGAGILSTECPGVPGCNRCGVCEPEAHRVTPQA